MPMIRIEDLCDKIDENRPDFLHEMKREKMIPMNLNDPVQLPKDKRAFYDKKVKAYYS